MESRPQNPEFRYNPENFTHALYPLLSTGSSQELFCQAYLGSKLFAKVMQMNMSSLAGKSK